MVFHSLNYLFFLAITIICYYALPHRFRWILLLALSYYFYASWNLELLALIVGVTLVTFLCALGIERFRYTKRMPLARACLWIGILIPLIMLFFFKYFDFFSETAEALFAKFSLPLHLPTLRLILPVGISFYTFQALSYVVDVSRGAAAERHPGLYALYISFFPQLVAGPIERADHLLPQFRTPKTFSYSEASEGLKRIALGLLKKMLVADTLAPFVDTAYSSPVGKNGFMLLAATFFFAIQIYCDFSGYSDIAIGSARMLGIRLSDNFRSPYFAQSVREFWKRWHISLSTWFMDYVYIPLGGNRKGLVRNCINLFVTFLLSGLWHGADWTFLAWGALHGIYIVIEKLISALRPRQAVMAHDKPCMPLRIAKTCFTFILVSIAWIFFRASTLSDAKYILCHLFNGFEHPLSCVLTGARAMGLSKERGLTLFVMILLLTLYDLLALKTDPIAKLNSLSAPVRWSIYSLIIVILTFAFLYATFRHAGEQFIYFQF